MGSELFFILFRKCPWLGLVSGASVSGNAECASLEFTREYFTKFWNCIFPKEMWKLPAKVFHVDFMVPKCYVAFSGGKLQPSL